MTEKQMVMKKINESSFAMDDAVLYLDTHPCDEEALAYYQKCVHARKEAMKLYNDKFGPLQADQVQGTNHWHWIHERWPWEVGGNC